MICYPMYVDLHGALWWVGKEKPKQKSWRIYHRPVGGEARRKDVIYTNDPCYFKKKKNAVASLVEFAETHGMRPFWGFAKLPEGIE